MRLSSFSYLICSRPQRLLQPQGAKDNRRLCFLNKIMQKCRFAITIFLAKNGGIFDRMAKNFNL